MWNYPAIENLKEVCVLVEELKQQGKSDGEKAELLILIAGRLQPHIGKIGKPVRLSWGQGVSVDDFVSFTPETGKEQLMDKPSSDRGIVLWTQGRSLGLGSEDFPKGDQIWLLSSGNFMYVKGSHRTDRGVDWGTESWVGTPFESDDPSKLPMPKDMDEVCASVETTLGRVLASVTEIDEDSFELLLSFPPEHLLSFLTYAPYSGAALESFGGNYRLRRRLIGMLNESEDWDTCRRAIEILERSSDRETMRVILQTIPPKRSSYLQSWITSWRLKLMRGE